MRQAPALYFLLFLIFIFCGKAFSQSIVDDMKELDVLAQTKPDSVLNVLNKMTFHSEKSNAYFWWLRTKAGAHNFNGNLDSSFFYYKKLMLLEPHVKDLVLLADTYNGMSEYHQKKGSLDSALVFCKDALNIGYELNDSSIINTSLNNLGITYLFKADYDSAFLHLEKSHRILASIKDTVRMAMVLNNLFYCKYKTNEIEEAAQFLLESLELKKKNENSKTYINGMTNLIALYIRLKKFDEAESLLHEQVRLTENNHLNVSLAGAYLNLGFIKSTKQKKDSALIYYKLAYSIYSEEGDLARQGRALRNCGAIYEDMGNYEEALEYSKKSLEINEKTGENEGILFGNINIGSILMNMGKPKEAKSYLLKAEELAGQMNSLSNTMDLNNKLARYYALTKDFEKAYKHYVDFKVLSDSVYSLETESSIRDIEAKYQNKEKQAEINQLEAEAKIKELEIREKERTVQTQRFILITVLVIILLSTSLGFLIFQRYKLKQENAKTELDRQRSEIEHRMIRSQMNPHFIFNSLNSVQSLIVENRNEDAGAYLNKFARLLRLILENSRNQYVPLSSEIESLRNYIEIEQLRFKNKFDYEIEDLTDDPEFIGVPPMLIQPFVENSILHGIKNKEGKGHIKLKYTISDDDILCCSVYDDGIGRYAAREMKQQSKNNKHKSLATTLTAERLDLFREKQGIDISLEIKDIEEKDKTGTLVEIKIPCVNI